MKKIFIIDNLNSIVELYADFFSLKGYKIAVASTVEDFIERQHKFNPDLVIYDTDMPGRESEKFSTYISSFPGTITAPIIFLTGFVNESKLRGFQNYHNSHFLSKSSANSKILNLVTGLIREYRSNIEPGKVYGRKASIHSGILNH